jgi:hypothetical protein
MSNGTVDVSQIVRALQAIASELQQPYTGEAFHGLLNKAIKTPAEKPAETL